MATGITEHYLGLGGLFLTFARAFRLPLSYVGQLERASAITLTRHQLIGGVEVWL